MKSCTPQELAEQLSSAQAPALLDVREPEEHAIASLPDARLIPLGELLDRLDELADWKDRPMVVYCHHGMRSAHAIHLLQSLGFQLMSNLQGGIDRWSQEVDPSVARY